VRKLGIALIVVGVALTVYAYGVGFPAFLAGILAIGLGVWLTVRAADAHAS
jgi:hypothetical protein